MEEENKTKVPNPLECRFYRNKFPEVDELVMTKVINVGEIGAYVVLPAYDNAEGLILLTELSRRRIRSINKLIRVNANEVAMVLRVDQEKGFIDLSKRRVDPEDVKRCEERFSKTKQVHGLLKHVASAFNKTLEEMYERIGWPLYDKYGHAYDAFKLAVSESEENVFEGIDVGPDMIAELLLHIKRKFATQPIKIKAEIEVTCFSYEGIDAIKEALLAGEKCGTENTVVKIRLISPPFYVITTMTLDKDLGIDVLNRAIAAVRETIEPKGGNMKVKEVPKAVTQREESEFQAMLDRLAVEAEEVDGDEPDEY